LGFIQFLIFWCVLFVQLSVWAAPSCYNLFVKKPARIVLVSAAANNFKDIEFLKQNLEGVRSEAELKDALYELAFESNKLIDSLVNIVLALESGKLPENSTKPLLKDMREMTAFLQVNYGLLDRTLINIVQLRTEAVKREMVEQLDQENARQEIGFLPSRQGPGMTDNKSQELSSDVQQDKQRIGFVVFKKIVMEENPQPQKIGFGRSGPREEDGEMQKTHGPGYLPRRIDNLSQSKLKFNFYIDAKTGYFDVDWWMGT
jgi:hypothetical protein